jgi:hypothetical protein
MYRRMLAVRVLRPKSFHFWLDGRQTGSNPSRELPGNRLNWRNIPIALIDN